MLVAQLMLVLDATVVNVALPRIDTDLGFGPASLSWVLNAYTLAFGGLLLLGGRLGDVRGRLRMFEIGLTHLHPLLAARRSRADARASWSWPGPSRVSARRWPHPACSPCSPPAPPTRPPGNRALALFGAVSSAGASIGLLLGGVVTDLGSWRWTLFINVPIGLAVLALARRFVTETPRRPGRFDVVGALTATVRCGRHRLVADRRRPEHGWLSVRTIAGFVGRRAAAARARLAPRPRHPHPLVQPHLVRRPPPGRRPGRDGAGDRRRTSRCSSWSSSSIERRARLRPVRDRAWRSCPSAWASSRCRGSPRG